MRAFVVTAFLGAILVASQIGVASAAGTAEPFHIEFSGGTIKLGAIDNVDLSNLDDIDLGPSGILLTSTGDAPIVDPPAVAKLRTRVLPKNKKTRAGHATKFKVTVKNSGETDATSVQVCVKHPNKALRVKRHQTIGNIPAGGSATRIFMVKPKPIAGRHSYRLRFTVKGRSLTQNTTGAKLLVR